MSTAYEALRLALEDLYEMNRGTPCQGVDRDKWVSDDGADQAAAAEACNGCVLWDECHAAALEIRATAGTWAGHTYGQPKRRKKTA